MLGASKSEMLVKIESLEERVEELKDELKDVKKERDEMEETYKKKSAEAVRKIHLETKEKEFELKKEMEMKLIEKERELNEKFSKKIIQQNEENFTKFQETLTKIHEEGNANTKTIKEFALKAMESAGRSHSRLSIGSSNHRQITGSEEETGE